MGTPIDEMNPVFLIACVGAIIGAVYYCYQAWHAGKTQNR